MPRMTEREMWWELAKLLEQAVAARPAASEEMLTGISHEVGDPEFFYLLVTSLGLSKHDDVDRVMRHPHYPGRDLRCDRYWCDTGAMRLCPLQRNGRCPQFYNPAIKGWDDPSFAQEGWN
jgi:hypothetical protein